MSVTIKELSEMCGLSVSTVSKALNGYTDISDATRRRVIEAANQMGYYPNAHARALKSGRSFNLGVLFVDDNRSGLSHQFFSGVLEAFKKEAESQGYDITFISHNMGDGRVTYMEHCRYREVDGVCIASVNFQDPEVIQLAQSGLPIATIDYAFDNRICIQSDNVGGMAALVEYIYRRGHRKIGVIRGPRSASTDSRFGSFCRMASLLNFDLPDEYILESPYIRPDLLYHNVNRLLSLRDRPTCILCCDDYSALGAYRAAAERGLRIPDDISIAGFDGIPLSQELTPKLTTVQQDISAIGATAAQRLIAQIESPRTSIPETVLIPCKLIEGETIADLTQIRRG